jgi:hypothetical protein
MTALRCVPRDHHSPVQCLLPVDRRRLFPARPSEPTSRNAWLLAYNTTTPLYLAPAGLFGPSTIWRPSLRSRSDHRLSARHTRGEPDDHHLALLYVLSPARNVLLECIEYDRDATDATAPSLAFIPWPKPKTSLFFFPGSALLPGVHALAPALYREHIFTTFSARFGSFAVPASHQSPQP